MRSLLQAFVDDAAPLAAAVADAAAAAASTAATAVAEGSSTTPVVPPPLPPSVAHAGLSLHSPLVAAVVGLHLAALAYFATRLAASARRAAEAGKGGADTKTGVQRAPPRKVGAVYDFGAPSASSFPPLRVLRHKAAQAARSAAASRAGRSLLGTVKAGGPLDSAAPSAVELLIRAGAAAPAGASPPRGAVATMAGATTVGAPLPPGAGSSPEAVAVLLPGLGALVAGFTGFAERMGLVAATGAEGGREAAC